MKFNIKNNSFIVTLISVVIFVFYKNFPEKIQIFLLLALGIYFAVNIGVFIYQRKYWEEILRMAVLFVVTIVTFINYYNSAFKFDNAFIKIALFTIGWTFPCLACTGVISWRRKGDINKYKQSLFFLVYSIILALFCTVIVIFK